MISGMRKPLTSLALVLVLCHISFGSTLLYSKVLDPTKGSSADTGGISIPPRFSILRVVIQPADNASLRSAMDPDSTPLFWASISAIDASDAEDDSAPFLYLVHEPVRSYLVYPIDPPPTLLSILVSGKIRVRVRVWGK